MQYDLPRTLEILKPGAQWVIQAASADDVTYASLDWKDEIALFHLNDKELRSSLESFAESH